MKPFTHYWCIFLFFFVVGVPLHSQTQTWRNFSEKNGLPSPVILCLFQDSQGYLWIGTQYGLSCFDGSKFQNFFKENGLPENVVFSLREDKMGRLWVGTFKGCATINLLKEGSVFSIVSELQGISVYSIVPASDGWLWLATSKGLYCFDGNKVFPFHPVGEIEKGNIFAIAFEPGDKTWLGTDLGLLRYEKNTQVNMNSLFNLQPSPVFRLLLDSQGQLWGNTLNGVNLFKDGKRTFYSEENGLIDQKVNSLMEDRTGKIWIGTNAGISIFNGKTFRNIDNRDGLPNNLIYVTLEDREGNIWAGTHGGLSCLYPTTIQCFSSENGLPSNIIYSITQDRRNHYWFGTSMGLSRYDGTVFKNYSTGDGLPGKDVMILLEDGLGNIWIGTAGGLCVYLNGEFKILPGSAQLPSEVIFEISEGRDNKIWIGTSGGIAYYQNSQFKTPPFNIDVTNVYPIMEDHRGNLWFGSGNHLYLYSEKRLSKITNQVGLPESSINCILEDSKGRIWIGMDSGLSCFENGSFKVYSPPYSEGLEKVCNFILEDARGFLWVGNSRRLSCFDGQRFTHYSPERLGLTSRTWLVGLKDNQNNLWFGSTEGVIFSTPPPVTPNRIPPPVDISSVKVMEKDVFPGKPGQFKYNQNIFRFNYVGLSFIAPGEVRYKYILEGIDKEWQLTADRSLFYPFLPAGDYTFKVKAINADGYESTGSAEYRFYIAPPFWQTWWFQLLLGILFFLFLFLVLHWRIKRINEKAELRAQKAELEARNRQLVMSQRMELMGTLAAGNVHDLKNLMSVIICYSRALARKHHLDEEDQRNIEIIKESADTTVLMAKQILSFARPKTTPNTESTDLVTECEDILATLKITQPKNIHILWHPPTHPVYFAIQPARFQQVVMNLCLNACQAMPKGGDLRIQLSVVDDTNDTHICLKISDQGEGIDPGNIQKIFEPLFTTKAYGQGTGLGLFVVKEIVSEHGGQIKVFSEPGTGSEFIVCFPCQPYTFNP